MVTGALLTLAAELVVVWVRGGLGGEATAGCPVGGAERRNFTAEGVLVGSPCSASVHR